MMIIIKTYRETKVLFNCQQFSSEEMRAGVHFPSALHFLPVSKNCKLIKAIIILFCFAFFSTPILSEVYVSLSSQVSLLFTSNHLDYS